jgi:hypothetical protein
MILLKVTLNVTVKVIEMLTDTHDLSVLVMVPQNERLASCNHMHLVMAWEDGQQQAVDF